MPMGIGVDKTKPRRSGVLPFRSFACQAYCTKQTLTGPSGGFLDLAQYFGTQKVVLDAIAELLRNEGSTPPDPPASLPSGCLAITVDDAIEQIRGRLVCEPKRRTERTQQALTALHCKGLITIEGGLIWKPSGAVISKPIHSVLSSPAVSASARSSPR